MGITPPISLRVFQSNLFCVITDRIYKLIDPQRYLRGGVTRQGKYRWGYVIKNSRGCYSDTPSRYQSIANSGT